MTVDANTVILTVFALTTMYNAYRDNRRADQLATKLDSVGDTTDKIHILTNSAMGAALRMNVVALESDAVSKHRIAEITHAVSDVAAAKASDIAIGEAQRLYAQHLAQQKKVDTKDTKAAN